MNKTLSSSLRSLLYAVLIAATTHAEEPATDDTEAALKASAAFRVPQEFTVELFAAKPQLVNPVAICLDELGRVYVAEDHRFLEGTPENRTHNFLLEDDLQVTTLADRLAMQEKWADKFDKGSSWFTQTSDIVRRLEDRDGDGRADRSTVFADGFDGPLDGLGSGLIARDGKVWYTCIPNLWVLQDTDDNGRADNKTALLHGFGVNAAFYGHDLHGLTWGVDGKLYFSVGDRGAHVFTKEGTTISNPRTGAVYRCNPDGTELERIHQGLRNPQELAFDQFGNLFADDNNCDKGDDSRLVYVVPGGDSGWNMSFQTIPEPYLTGPWHAEGMWHMSHELQPAYIVPPVGKIGAGPSGFVFSSGSSLPARFENHFFYCNYTGNGGVESFAVRKEGAGFTIVDHQDFCKPILASDIDFGYDGKMYIADYVGNPWDRSTSGGRIYTLFDKSKVAAPAVAQTRELFRGGFDRLSIEQLVELLHHHDMRVRLRAQFTLATRDASQGVLTKTARDDTNQLARLHAMWGLGQLGRRQPMALEPIVDLLSDQDSEVRAQAAKLVGEARFLPAADAVLPMLSDASARVRFFATLALGSLEHEAAVPAIFEMLSANAGNDRFLVHAGVVALEQIDDRNAVALRARDQVAAVRMAVLLVQRRWRDSRIIQFLDDAELNLVTEAARAINDLPLVAGREALADLADRYRNASGEKVVPLMRRIVNANYQLGRPSNIEAVIRVAASDTQPDMIRAEAIAALASWPGPANRDRVTGYWQPLAARDATQVRNAVQAAASDLLATVSGELQTQVTELLTALKVETDDQSFAQWVSDETRTVGSRIAAVRLLVSRKYAGLPQVIDHALASMHPELRAEVRDHLSTLDPSRAATLFSQLFDDPQASILEKQRAFGGLARMKTAHAARVLDGWARRLQRNAVPESLQLDLLEALELSPNPIRTDAVRAFYKTADDADSLFAFRAALTGGNAEVGRAIFVSHQTAQCVRCHSVDGQAGKAGPNLSKVGSGETKEIRRFLLESIVHPNAKIAKGFGTVTLVLNSGKIVAGTIQEENEQSITLLTPQNETVLVDRESIDERTETTSTMPSMKKVLSLREVRDLVAYLATLAMDNRSLTRESTSD